MRLTYITTTSFPATKASSVQVMQMCAAFAQAGALVKLVSRLPEGDSSSGSFVNIFEHYAVPKIFQFDAQPMPHLPRAADIFQVRAALKERGADWICYTRGRDLTAPLVALWRGAYAMVEVHGRPLTARESIFLRWIAQHPRGRIITISEPLQKIYQSEYGIESHIAMDGVDLNRFDPLLTKEEARARLGLGTGKLILYVGGLYEGRGLETLFKGAADSAAQLLIVGGRDVNEIAEWRKRAENLGAHNIRFEGYQSPSRVPLYLFAADILAMPYGARTMTPGGEDTTAWMSPLKLFEYLAAGRPIVASDLPALRSILVREHNALLTSPDDADSFSAALKQLLNDKSLCQRLAANARATVDQHTWLARAKKILEIV